MERRSSHLHVTRNSRSGDKSSLRAASKTSGLKAASTTSSLRAAAASRRKSTAKKLLPARFYSRATQTVARDLLGRMLCRRLPDGRILRGVISETEAYLGLKDPSCHSFHGKQTDRVRSMYESGGHSYVYFIYGMYFCLNAVTRAPNHPEAVLIRAVIPLGEIANQKTDGPGKLCRVFQIDRKDDGLALWKRSSDLWIEEGQSVVASQVIKSPRVGIGENGDHVAWPLRFRAKAAHS